jgi:uncharacterized protein (DUF4415 family)
MWQNMTSTSQRLRWCLRILKSSSEKTVSTVEQARCDGTHWGWLEVGHHYYSSYMFVGNQAMAKKSSESSQQEKLVRVKAEVLFNRPLTRQQRERLDRLSRKPDSEIDTSDIPPLTDAQLAEMVPYRLRSGTTLVSIRLPNDVLTWLKSKGPGHLSRINAILTNVMDAEHCIKNT